MKNHEPSDFQIHGFCASHWQEAENSLLHFHRHNEIELNFLNKGTLKYLIGGRAVALKPRTLSLFWGGCSHRIVEWEPYGDIWALSIPLQTFLSWKLPKARFIYPLLNGEVLHAVDPDKSDDDLKLMQRWHDDLLLDHRAGTSTHRDIMLLEVQARLLRMSMNMKCAPAPVAKCAESERVCNILKYIAEHYAEADLSIRDIADTAHTNHSYAMDLFKKICGISIMQYVNDQRVAHAQRMLATTDAKIIDIAMDAGFGSLSQFHAVFKKVCGKTPKEYARTIHYSAPL